MNWSDWQAELLEQIADPARAVEAAPALNPAGLAVYRNNYRVGLIDTLAFIYPVCRQLVGEDFFSGLARAFIGGHPSHSGNLHLYGAGFGDFIAGFEHARELPYLADVARLEWRVHRAYYAADAAPVDSAALAAFPQQRWVSSDCGRCPMSPPCSAAGRRRRSGWPTNASRWNWTWTCTGGRRRRWSTAFRAGFKSKSSVPAWPRCCKPSSTARRWRARWNRRWPPKRTSTCRPACCGCSSSA